MVLRWVAVAVVETSKTFRKLRGHVRMPRLVAALRAPSPRPDLPLCSREPAEPLGRHDSDRREHVEPDGDGSTPAPRRDPQRAETYAAT
jgi:hypothetical protein